MIQSHECQLKILSDQDPKSLGRSHLQAGSVTIEPPLVKGQDYELGLRAGTIRALRPAVDEAERRRLFTVRLSYDDRAEVFKALEDERAAARQKIRDLRAKGAAVVTPTDLAALVEALDKLL